MKKILALLLATFFSISCYAQNTTTLYGVVVDSDSQVWAGAFWTATIVIPGGGGTAKFLDGTSVPNTYSGFLLSSGAFPTTTPVVGNVAKIVPTGVTWKYCFYSLTSAAPSCFNQATQGASFAMGSYAHTIITPPRIQAGGLVYAYNTTEIQNSLHGNGYVNTVTGNQYIWNGSTYIQISGGGFAPNAINANIIPVGDPSGNGNIINSINTIDSAGNYVSNPVGYSPEVGNLYTSIMARSFNGNVMADIINSDCDVNSVAEYGFYAGGVNIHSLQIGKNSPCATGGSFQASDDSFLATEQNNLWIGSEYSGNSVYFKFGLGGQPAGNPTDVPLTLGNDGGANGIAIAETAAHYAITPNQSPNVINIAIDSGGHITPSSNISLGGPSVNQIISGTLTTPSGSCSGTSFVFDLTGNLTVCKSGTYSTIAGGTGIFAPFTNPTGGQNNYAPLASPTFTGTINTPAIIASSIVDSALTAGSLPICPNGPGGSFTQSGCAVSAGSYTFTDVTASRAFSTTYQNNTGSVLFISGYGTTSLGTQVGEINVLIGPSSASLDVYSNQSTATISGGGAGFIGTVLPGYFYEVTATGSAGIGLTRWVETTISSGGGGTGVTTFNGRSGSVTSTAGDYTVAQVTGAAPLASPTLTGAPLAPTQSAADNSTKIATTAYVTTAVAAVTAPVTSVFTRVGNVVANSGDYTVSQVTGAAPLASPSLTGTPTAPTQSIGNNSTALATTAYADGGFLALTGSHTASGTYTFNGPGVSISNLTYTVAMTATNCASAASPAVCGTAAAGRFVVAAGATTVTVNTTRVTANSEIEIQPDASLGTALGVTCNTTLASIIGPVITSRVAGTSFTVSISGTLVTNPACYSYSITN